MPPISAAPRPDGPPPPAPGGGFTLAEVLIALAIALLITTAAASALTVVLRSERATSLQRRAHFQAASWLAGKYSGSGETPGVKLGYRETGRKDDAWQWVSVETEPGAAGRPTARVWTRAAADAPAR